MRASKASTASLVTEALVSSALLIAAAGKVWAASAGETPSFAAISDLLDRRCAVCHNEAGAAGAADLNLEAGQSYVMLLRKSTESALALVEPGFPDKSYLMAKLWGVQAKLGGSGATMPAGQGSLAPAELELIRSWIQDGARP